MLTFLNDYFSNLSQRACFLHTLAITLCLGVINYYLAPEISFAVFYTLPIVLAGWYAGKQQGVLLAVLSALLWLTADILAGNQYSSGFIPVWNSLVRLLFFIIILSLLLELKKQLAFVESLAHSDALTGLANRRYFQEKLDQEFARAKRYSTPFTIAYLDLDNFKQVNDTEGHDVGDQLLQATASVLKNNLRGTDVCARLGGDEFAVFFPHLYAQQAPALLEKIRFALLKEMGNNNWPVTFSIGAVTFNSFDCSNRDMMKKVDDLMYEVKKTGKNNLRHHVWQR